MTNFVAYQVALELVTELRPILEQISKHDSNIADQMRRAATSVVLNLAEGSRRVKGNQRRAYSGEAREVLGCLDCAAAFGYVTTATAARAKLDRLLRLCWGLTHAKSAS